MSKTLDGHLFGDDREEIAADDWSDQDLLTKDEAGARIEAIVAQTNEELAAARVSAPEKVAGLEDYLRRLKAVLAMHAQHSDPTV